MGASALQATYKETVTVNGQQYVYYDVNKLDTAATLPFSIKILLESAIRQYDGTHITEQHIDQLKNWGKSQYEKKEVPFKPARIVFQDFTGIPAIVDLAAMRNAIERRGGEVSKVNPQIPVDLVIDHSVIIENSGSKASFSANVEREYERNLERYRFVRWAKKSFSNFRTVPPSNGIVHQVNLEYLASSVVTKEVNGEVEVSPDSLVGTDSHTPMINGLGTVGWGVGGIEAEAAMLGQPLYFVLPEVVGMKLTGRLQEGVTATDLALTVTRVLRQKGVVGKFVEFFGTGIKDISLTDRATISNMAPEYGATMGYFPVDDETMDYLTLTGRGDIVPLATAYYKAQGLYRTDQTPDPDFTEVIELHLATVKPTIAGPKRPQDSVELGALGEDFKSALVKPVAERGFGLGEDVIHQKVTLSDGTEIGTGSVVLASITSCTNTSNPSVMVAAGLVAKKAVELGLQKPSFVKSSLTPGSKVVTKYLESAGLLRYLEKLGFFVDGYGCATCCGNSGALAEEVEEAIKENNLVVASILSGNRNFEGRVHPLIKANYLSSPPLVIAYSLAGTVIKNVEKEPIGIGHNNTPVYLKDIWPTSEEIQSVISNVIDEKLFKEQYDTIFENERWSSLEAPEGNLYEWDTNSTYIQEAPYFNEGTERKHVSENVKSLKVLLLLGDSITTDHISPAGHIPVNSPAGLYLAERGVSPRDFNAYGARRGNHEVMVRGTFANIRIKNKLAAGIEGGYTTHLPTGETMSVFEAAMKYKETNQNLLIIAGKEYGTGSSRDWAAKGTSLLGVKVVLAEGFERIHRSNLVGMGVLPLQFIEGENASTLNLDGTEDFTIKGLEGDIMPYQEVTVIATGQSTRIEFRSIVRLDSSVEVDYYNNGGILPSVEEKLMKG